MTRPSREKPTGTRATVRVGMTRALGMTPASPLVGIRKQPVAGEADDLGLYLAAVVAFDQAAGAERGLAAGGLERHAGDAGELALHDDARMAHAARAARRAARASGARGQPPGPILGDSSFSDRSLRSSSNMVAIVRPSRVSRRPSTSDCGVTITQPPRSMSGSVSRRQLRLAGFRRQAFPHDHGIVRVHAHDDVRGRHRQRREALAHDADDMGRIEAHLAPDELPGHGLDERQ